MKKKKQKKNSVFWENYTPFSTEFLTGYIGISIWIIIMSTLDQKKNWGRFLSGDLVILL